MVPSGVLVIDKPAGPTSNDIVQIVKRITKAKRVGHLGTLDPSASGVLPLAIGGATKRAGELVRSEKTYEFTLWLGTATTTDDADGDVIAQTDAPQELIAELRSILPNFIGSIMQVPPKYSAVWVDGSRAYNLARRGVEFTLPPRPVVIDSLEIVDENWPEIRMRVTCNSGTYVRSLCRDLGEALGCGGHAKDIRRIQSGPYNIGEAITLDKLQNEPQEWLKQLIPA